MGSFNYDNNDQELDENGLPVEDNPDLKKAIENAITDDVEYFNAQNQADIDYFNAQNQADIDYFNAQNQADIDAFNDTSPYEYYYENEDEDEEDDEETATIGDLVQNGSDLAKKIKNTDGSSNWFSRFAGGGKGAKIGKLAGKAGSVGGASVAGTAGAAGGTAAASGGIAAALPIIGWVLLVLLILILVIVVICAVVNFFDKKTNPENMSNNSYITSEYFYGVRSVYIDEEALLNSLQLSYKQYAVNILDYLDDTQDVTLNITLPEEFDNTTSVDQHIINISIGVGNVVATGSSDYAVEFTTLYPQIEYFGLTPNQSELVNVFLADYISDNNLITNNSSSLTIDLINEISNYQTMQYMFNLCEKVMIKDEIATSIGLGGIEKRQYVASIYMPNKEIVVKNTSYTIVNENEDFTTNVKLVEVKDGLETIHVDYSLEENTEIIDGNDENITLTNFISIDSNNIQAFSKGLSLFDAICSLPIGVECFALNDGIYTWKPIDENMLYLTFEASNEFIFTEFNIDIKLAN